VSFPRPVLRPGQMAGAGAVAAFAADADFGKSRVVGVGGRVIVLVNRGRMAFRAHIVPVLLAARPMQDVARRNRLVAIDVEPALPPLLFRARIPGPGKDLHTPV